RGDDANHVAGNRAVYRSAHRRRDRGQRERDARSLDSDGRAGDSPRREISRCGLGGMRSATAAARVARRSRGAAGARYGAPRRSRGRWETHSFIQSRCTRRSRRMSVEVNRLASGLVVVTDRMAHLETASLGVWIGAGSRDERPDEHGISHLLEHMAFKGTSRRSARQIAEEIEAVGGDLNAATSVETTAYYARVLRADVPLALDVLSDILTDPAFDAEE